LDASENQNLAEPTMLLRSGAFIGTWGKKVRGRSDVPPIAGKKLKNTCRCDFLLHETRKCFKGEQGKGKRGTCLLMRTRAPLPGGTKTGLVKTDTLRLEWGQRIARPHTRSTMGIQQREKQKPDVIQKGKDENWRAVRHNPAVEKSKVPKSKELSRQ